ncbi:putative transcription factor C2H2 family [Helianthus annuus]|nr:putative transcription factor C2H2 family [Helianthus annuus]
MCSQNRSMNTLKSQIDAFVGKGVEPDTSMLRLSGPSRGQGGTTRTSTSTGTSNGGQVEKVHEKNGVMKATLDVCPKCSKGFCDPVSLVEHVEREHRGTFKALTLNSVSWIVTHYIF